MTQTVTVTGMVLSSAPIGEFDRRIVLLTKEKGKISAFAKGARRPTSHLLGIVNPFSFGEFTLYEGRSSYNLMQGKITNYFTELRENVEAAYYGFYFMEFAGYYAKEYTDETESLKLLYQSLRALLNPHLSNELVRYIFELKLIAVHGEGPQVFSCLGCGKKEGPFVFCSRRGGILCGNCKNQEPDAIHLDNSTLYTLQYIVASPIGKLYTFTVSDEVLRRLGKILKRYKDVYVEQKFKSLEMLELVSGVKD